uniref:Putative secreted protein n=1 Tax=Ixodes ricinus TaxID=34613 RepID=A0A6B0UFK5_IXORI
MEGKLILFLFCIRVSYPAYVARVSAYTQKLATGKRVNSLGAVLGGCRRACGLPYSSLGLNCHRSSVDGVALLYAALPVTYSTGRTVGKERRHGIFFKPRALR